MIEPKTYRPDNVIHKGYLHIFKEIFSELGSNKYLIWQLFKRDFLAIYKQSFVGFLWAVIIPVISVGTFLLLNKSGVFNIENMQVPYPLFAIMGMAFWQLFATGLIASSNSLVKAGAMVVKINFSKKSLVIASFGQALVSFIVQIVIVIILLVVYGTRVDLFFFLLPLWIMPILMFTMGLGFILSILNGIMRDVGNIISVIVTFFLFLTPVLYPKPTHGLLSTISKYNPLFYLVSVPREMILYGRSQYFSGYLMAVALSIFVFIICMLVFHVAETRVTERI